MRIIRAIFVLLLLAAIAANLVGCNFRNNSNRDNGTTDAGATATVPSDSGGEKTGGDSDSKDTNLPIFIGTVLTVHVISYSTVIESEIIQ